VSGESATRRAATHGGEDHQVRILIIGGTRFMGPFIHCRGCPASERSIERVSKQNLAYRVKGRPLGMVRAEVTHQPVGAECHWRMEHASECVRL
jgi:hypothetical protein